jgi:Zn-finger nucleic acid-binding protein
MEGGVLTFIDQHDHVAAGETICTKDTLCACGAVVIPATGHVDADANGICDNCNWDMNLVEVNIAIGTDPKYNGVRVDDEAGKALSWTWSNGGFDAVISKGTSTFTLYTTAKDYMQLKKQNLLTIVNTNDETVQYVVISVTTASYLNTLKTAIGTQYEFTADETNFTVTIQLNSTEDFVLENQSASTVYVNGVSIVYAKKGAHVHEHSFTYSCDAHCAECGEFVREASHNIAHIEAKAATCYENGNIEYWYCEACGQAWLDADCTRNTNLKAVVLPMAHAEATHVEAKAATCYENGNIEYWYCETCGQAWLDADCTRNTNLKAVVLPMAHAEATHVEAKAPTTTENGNIEYWYCEACGQAWLDADCTLNTNLKAVVLPMIVEDAPVDTPDEPVDTPDEPVVELNFFQRIWLAILTFFKKLFGLI